ncbi:MAG TPA: 2-oxo acid dehydrogenase subunit E2, partial [Candidatus Thermoplasmatota archaeon]|nr:2-oxo acid dehydrogenase subunit E2 [Candidatus Thermoplasmatota archaeon]
MMALEAGLEQYVDAAWPPMAHVRRGWARLDEANRALVLRRLDETLARFRPATGADLRALRRFFSFLSQVEVIAIEVPLSALPTARDEVRPLLERQLADEVFHAAVFAALARRLGGLDRPLPEAERVLDHIRRQEDPRTTAVLLNLVAEGWIENLFDHAVTWGVADEVFRIVLEDESRHVEEAHQHAEGVDLQRVGEAVRAFEQDLFRLAQHPRVLLPVVALAGEERFQALGRSFLEVHASALAEAGVAPSEPLVRLRAAVDEAASAQPPPRPREVEPATQWRRTALELWDTPRSPVMNGWCEVRVDHVPRRLLTAVVVAAMGKVWRELPRMNRYVAGGRVWAPEGVHVGVRVALGDKGEALSTVVVPDADRRSVQDVRRLVQEGTRRMNEAGAGIERVGPGADDEPLRAVLRDEELMAFVPPGTVAAPVTVSNVGKAGLYAGWGAMPGALGQSLEVVIGRVEKRPQWTGWRYKPVDTVVVCFSADHRVFDGQHVAEAMARFREAMSPAGVRELLDRPDTLTEADVGR